MPYTLSWISSFERDIKGLDPRQKATVKLALHALLIYFSTNSNLQEAQKTAPGFFFKQLRRPFYETGIEGKLRIVLRKDDLTFFAILAGNHDDVKRFLSKA